MAEARIRWSQWIGWVAIIGILGAALGPYAPQMAGAFANVSLHAPHWALWVALPLKVQVHIVSALLALALGAAILVQPKGTRAHKALGWAAVVAMISTVVTSLFMVGLNGNSYSFIHLLSGWSIIALPLAIYAIRNRNVARHRRLMTGMFVWGLLIAGALTFLPGRFMFNFLLG